MNDIILVAGATGHLGGKICKQLLIKGASVKALIRKESDRAKVDELRKLGTEIITIDFADEAALLTACNGVSCVVSVLAGLRDVIVTAQCQLLNAAIKAGVPRFIPSDFCTDFTRLKTGDNRNFDLRKEFQLIIDSADIKATSIFNGAFAHVLRYNIPLLDTKNKSVSYYSRKADWHIDFTAIDDTAIYTALAAMDIEAPRYLRIASFRVNPNEIAELTKRVFGEEFELKEQGPLEQFAAYIKIVRNKNPEGEHQLYPQWQQMQYLYSMFAAHHNVLDNNRYPGLTWQTVEGTFLEIKNQSRA